MKTETRAEKEQRRAAAKAAAKAAAEQGKAAAAAARASELEEIAREQRAACIRLVERLAPLSEQLARYGRRYGR